MTERLSTDALRELFLFEKLKRGQLAWLADRGEVRSYPAGVTVHTVGEPATRLFVLLEGTLSMSVRGGGGEIEVVRTDHRGAYTGAAMPYIDAPIGRLYVTTVRAVTGCRFWELAAADWSWAMLEWFPMAVHLLQGFAIQGMGAQDTVNTRERLVALGSVTAGLTHELNNPATAAARATATLRERLAGLWGELAALDHAGLEAGQLATLIDLVREVQSRRAEQAPTSPLQASDLEDELGDWLDDHGVTGGWDLTPPLVAAGVDAAFLERFAASLHPQLLSHALGILAIACEAVGLLDEQADATGRVSKLIGAAKQYTQMDRAPLQLIDIHEGLESTLTMLGHKLGADVEVRRDYDRSLPKLSAYAGELNQVWTNLIDNAVDAMEGHGTLTVRTRRDGERVLIEIGDTGPGIPEAIRGRIFEPFYSTKPVGKGTGLGLDICWRIVVQRHNGDLRVTSTPGDTRFQVLLPISGPQTR